MDNGKMHIQFLFFLIKKYKKNGTKETKKIIFIIQATVIKQNGRGKIIKL